MALPASSGTPHTPAWVSALPLLLLSIAGIVLVLWLAPRKGRSRWLALIACIPCWGFLVVAYLLALTDKRVLDDVESLKKQIDHQPGDGPKG